MTILRILFLPVSVGLVIAATFMVPLPMFVESPVDLVSLGEAVEVQVPDAQPLSGDYLLSAVAVARATTAGFVRALIDDDLSVVGERALVPPGVDDATYFAHQRTLFLASTQIAAAVGLAAAGYEVDPEAVTGEGVLVMRVLPGAPAAGVLAAGDVLTAIGGTQIRTLADLRQALAETGPGPVEVAVIREGRRGSVTVRAGREAATGQVALGVIAETHLPSVQLPVPVHVDVDRIGGPSAGLLLALTVYDQATGQDLAGGRRITGSGAIQPDGTVRPVGGIRQKIASAVEAGIEVFMTAVEQEPAAREFAAGRLEVVGVANFAEAVAALSQPRHARGLSTSGSSLPAIRQTPGGARGPLSATLGVPPWSTPGG